MTSRELILKNIKENNVVKDVKLPSYENFGMKFEDKFQTFSTMIESVGGKALVIDKADLDKTIKELYPDEKQIASNVEYCSLGNFEQNSFDDVHDLRDIDLLLNELESITLEELGEKLRDMTHIIPYGTL